MSTFRVSPSDLENLASRLAGLLGELELAAANVKSSASRAAQNAQLEGAIDGFLSRWSHSIQNIKTNMTEVADRLSTAGAHYERTEGDIVDHFNVA